MNPPKHAESSRQTAPLVEIERSEHDGVRVVTVTGELDISNVAALEDATFDLPNDALGIVLDLCAATYIDSATLGLMFKLQRSLQRRGQILRVACAPGSSPQRVLELTGFGQEVDWESDRAAAIAAIQRDVRVHE
jgi:anti-anti-sigma factor